MCVGRSDSVMREQKGDSEVTRKPQWAIFWGGVSWHKLPTGQ